MCSYLIGRYVQKDSDSNYVRRELSWCQQHVEPDWHIVTVCQSAIHCLIAYQRLSARAVSYSSDKLHVPWRAASSKLDNLTRHKPKNWCAVWVRYMTSIDKHDKNMQNASPLQFGNPALLNWHVVLRTVSAVRSTGSLTVWVTVRLSAHFVTSCVKRS